MFNLDPGKLLVIGVVAIILLGPDRLPQVARQLGGAWRSFNEFRHKMESEVRNTMPDLPPTSEIARLARSPSALLNHLSNMSSDEELPDGSFQPPTMDEAAEPSGTNGNVGNVGVADTAPAAPESGDETDVAPAEPTATPAPTPMPTPTPTRADRPNTAAQPSGVVVPADPTLN
jgi:sec-independent protein translocase protein TatB